MELHREVAADCEGLNARVIGRHDRRRRRRQAPVAVKLQPGTGRDQSWIGRVDHLPADLHLRHGLDLAAEGGAHGLRAEADPEYRHARLVNSVQPGEFLPDPDAWRTALVDGRDRPEHDDVIHAVQRRQRSLAGEEMGGQFGAALDERIGDESRRVFRVMPDHDHSHGGSPRLPYFSFGAKLLAMTPAVDLTDLDMWVRGVPYREFARLRCDAPVGWFDEAPPNSGFWSVHRYADIVAASRDVATFSSSRGISFEEPTDDDMAARRTIIDTDPPDHTKLRKIFSGSFTQRAVAVYEHFVDGLTEEVLDAGLPLGPPFEFVDAVAKEVPIRVLARIMGLPEADLPLFIDLGDRLIANTDPEITDVVWGRDDTDAYRLFPFRSPYGKQLWDLGREIVSDKLRSPGDDLLSRLIRAEVDGDRLSEVDIDNFFSIMVIAGNETTRIAIAQGVLAFCEHPEQWERLRADPGLADTAAEEVLRWTCPTHFMRRTAAADTELGGAPIRAGDKVVLWYVSGNRDEAEFADPDVFDVARSPNRHLSFGRGGPHLCLGAHLARLEVRVMLAALARRVSAFELAGPPRRIRSNFTNGLRELPVRIRLG